MTARLSLLPRAAVAALLGLTLGWSVPLAARPQEPGMVQRVFSLRYRGVEEALALVRPLLSDAGSLSLSARTSTLTVRDRAAVVESITKAIEGFDLPPRYISLAVSLFKASTPAAVPPAASMLSEKGSVGSRLRELFNFTAYERLDAVTIQSREGDHVASQLGRDYRIDFSLDLVGEQSFVRLKGLSLQMVHRDAKGKESIRTIALTTINIPLEQSFVLGIGRGEAGAKALFLVFVATRIPTMQGPGIAE